MEDCSPWCRSAAPPKIRCGLRKIDTYLKMIRWFKPVVFLACLVPLGLLGWKAYSGGLGANPIEVITHATGDWTLRFLLITLAVTPIRVPDGAALA